MRKRSEALAAKAQPSFEDCSLNGLVCPLCGAKQRKTPSGDCCSEHGGIEGIKPEEFAENSSVRAARAASKPTRKDIADSADIVRSAEETVTRVFDQAVKEQKRLDEDVGPNVFPDRDLGEQIEVTMGEIVFAIPQYRFSTFRVGPYKGVTRVRPGETRADASIRVLRSFRPVAEQDLSDKLAFFESAMVKIKGLPS